MQVPEEIKKQLKEMAENEEKLKRKMITNPLSQYSTTQLKAELKRRKKGGIR